MSCLVASLHASRDLDRGGCCDCEHCVNDCDCGVPQRRAEAFIDSTDAATTPNVGGLSL